LIRERVIAGMAQARRDGKHCGRPGLRQFSAADIEQIRVARSKERASIRQLAIQHQTTQYTIGRILAGQYAGS
jgi:DNA invertase Pin-like site-specific DNA recombinase